MDKELKIELQNFIDHYVLEETEEALKEIKEDLKEEDE